jgi:hypothetical protein
MMIVGVPTWVTNFLQGDPEPLGELAKFYRLDDAVLVPSVTDPDFLAALIDILSTPGSVDSTYIDPILEICQNLLRLAAPTDTWLCSEALIDSILPFFLAGNPLWASAAAATVSNFCIAFQSHTTLLLEKGVVSLIGNYFAEHPRPKQDASSFLILICVLYRLISVELYPELIPFLPILLEFASSQFPKLRITAAKAIVCAIHSPEVCEYGIREFSLGEALLNALELNQIGQLHWLYASFARLIEYGYLAIFQGVRFWQLLFELFRTSQKSYKNLEYEGFGQVCAVVRDLTPDFAAELLESGIMEKFVAIALGVGDIRSPWKCEAAAVVGQFMASAARDQCAVVLEWNAFEAVLEVFGSAPGSLLPPMLDGLERVMEDWTGWTAHALELGIMDILMNEVQTDDKVAQERVANLIQVLDREG